MVVTWVSSREFSLLLASMESSWTLGGCSLDTPAMSQPPHPTADSYRSYLEMSLAVANRSPGLPTAAALPQGMSVRRRVGRSWSRPQPGLQAGVGS
jgi:hypothetical protein